MKQETKHASSEKTRKGSALIFATIVLFAILTVMIVLSTVTVMEQKMAQKTKSSTGAFFNAESGVEWALNKIATTASSTISGTFGTSAPGNGIDCPDFGSGSPCKIYLLGSDGKVLTTDQDIANVVAVRSVGTQYVGGTPDTSRTIEAAVAAGVEDVMYRMVILQLLRPLPMKSVSWVLPTWVQLVLTAPVLILPLAILLFVRQLVAVQVNGFKLRMVVLHICVASRKLHLMQEQGCTLLLLFSQNMI